MLRPAPLPGAAYERIVRRALEEDLGRAGDVTSAAVIPPGTVGTGVVIARSEGCVAGLDVAAATFRALDPEARIERDWADGDVVGAGTEVMRVTGDLAGLLAAERTALNFLGHLSGIATATRRAVDAVAGHDVRIADTRKTTPGLRMLEKYAVRAGGGSNHRHGLDDAVLIKDNHRRAAGGVGEAVRRARERVGHLVRVEAEVESLEEVDEALAAGVDALLLDNMSPAELHDAVARIGGQVTVEASGGITPDNVAEIAATGVDVISLGWITHSAPALDLSLEISV